MNNGLVNVVKGNEGEITAVYNEKFGTEGPGHTVQQRGVDSSSTLSDDEKSVMVARLAERLGAVVVMTGKTDFVSEGGRTFSVANGHEYLGRVTGTGCVLGTVISAMVAVYPDQQKPITAVLAGMLLFEIAAEVAAERPDVQGPGTFVPAFIDELARLRKLAAEGDLSWLTRSKVQEYESVSI